MHTLSLIIKKIVKTDNNVFQPNYDNSDNISGILKIFFTSLLGYSQHVTIKNKFGFFKDMLSNIFMKEKLVEFIDFFCKIQKIYKVLNTFVVRYKYYKSKIVVNTDIELNTLEINDKNVICILQENSRYLFHINDLIKIITTSLTNANMFFSEPLKIKNPYNNIPFNKATLYNIYFFIKFKTNIYPEFFFKFFECDFNLTCFIHKHEYILREYNINNYVYKSTSNILVNEIESMILNFNTSVGQIRNKKSKIEINSSFPKELLIKIMQPYLLLYCISKYSLLYYKKMEAKSILRKKMELFHKYNPNFGRKRYKIIVNTKNLKKKIIGKIVEFDDKHIPFNDIKFQNEIFLKDHLEFNECPYYAVNSTRESRFSFYFSAFNQNINEEDNNDEQDNNDDTEEDEYNNDEEYNNNNNEEYNNNNNEEYEYNNADDNDTEEYEEYDNNHDTEEQSEPEIQDEEENFDDREDQDYEYEQEENDSIS